jgi:hypothetical protein
MSSISPSQTFRCYGDGGSQTGQLRFVCNDRYICSRNGKNAVLGLGSSLRPSHDWAGCIGTPDCAALHLAVGCFLTCSASTRLSDAVLPGKSAPGVRRDTFPAC